MNTKQKGMSVDMTRDGFFVVCQNKDGQMVSVQFDPSQAAMLQKYFLEYMPEAMRRFFDSHKT